MVYEPRTVLQIKNAHVKPQNGQTQSWTIQNPKKEEIWAWATPLPFKGLGPNKVEYGPGPVTQH